MTEAEFAKLVASMKAVYTSPSFLPDEYAIEVWFRLLNDLEYRDAALNLQHFMQTETRQPMPADLRKNPAKVKALPTEGEAWTMVHKALQNGIYHAKEEFEKLPREVQRAVGCSEQLEIWAKSNEFNEGVAASNFKRVYRIECERQVVDSMISPRLKAECEKRLALEGGK